MLYHTLNTNDGHGLGWVPDLPDFRDYNPEHKEISEFFKKRDLLGDVKAASKNKIIPETNFSPIEDQQTIGSCTANAAVGLMEYYQKKVTGKHIDMSRLFLYKASRNLLGWTGDTGAYLRTTMAAMTLFGCPPEKYWPYVIKNFDNEPTSFLYSFAKEFQAVKYYRIDSLGITEGKLLNRIKKYIDLDLPMMFGFTVYSSISQAGKSGGIPFPCSNDSEEGGHAVVAVGYDDQKTITNKNCNTTTKGAIKIRNSWGTDWGENGYGWLPYEYVLKGLALDWWSIVKNEWTDLKVFGL